MFKCILVSLVYTAPNNLKCDCRSTGGVRTLITLHHGRKMKSEHLHPVVV